MGDVENVVPVMQVPRSCATPAASRATWPKIAETEEVDVEMDMEIDVATTGVQQEGEHTGEALL